MAGLAFRPGNAWVYRLHPLVKGAAVMGGILFLSLHRLGLQATVAALLGLVLTMVSGRVPVRESLSGLRGILVLLVVVGLAQAWRPDGWDWLGAGDAVARIVGVFLTAAVFVTISSQAELLYFWEACFRPLDLFSPVSREVALVMVIAVRFLPVILAEIDRIRLAQMARGAKFQGGWGPTAAREFLPLLVPTLALSIQRAGHLAVAMEARCYRLTSPRTRYRVYAVGIWDILLAVAIPVLLVFGFFGAGSWRPVMR